MGKEVFHVLAYGASFNIAKLEEANIIIPSLQSLELRKRPHNLPKVTESPGCRTVAHTEALGCHASLF